MGRDKALLPWGDGTLLDHAVDRLRQVCGEVRLLCGPTPRYVDRGLAVDLDARPGTGALGGLLAGLEHLGPARAGLFLAVDVPHVSVDLLAFLLTAGADADAVVPVTAAGPEPLCACYHGACAGAVRARLDAGERRMTSFWPDVRVLRVGSEELARFGDPARLFANLNTPEQYARDAGAG